MKILVDSDACPVVIKEIICRASKRLKLETIFFANHFLTLPKSPYIKFVLVSHGFDVADEEIEKMVSKGDLVITSDIPLANKVIEKKASAINIRGEEYSLENIKERLSMRNFMEDLRGAGQHTGGPSALSKKDQQTFANALDRFLSKNP